MAKKKNSVSMEDDWGMDGGMDMYGIDWSSTIVSIILIAVGIWFLAGAFTQQFNVTARVFNFEVAAWYVIGVALVMFGKKWMYRGCCY